MNVEKVNMQYGGDIFSINKKEVSPGRWFFATNRANLLTILASGIICPSNCYAKYYDDLLAFSGNSIPLLRDGLCIDLTERVTGGNSARFPVLLEINLGSISEIETDFVDSAGVVTRSLPDKFAEDVAMKLIGAIPITAVQKIHFQNQEEKADFFSRGFDNVPFGNIPAEVSGDLFNINKPVEVDKFCESLKTGTADISLKKKYRYADSLAGALVMFLSAIPEDKSWIERASDAFKCTIVKSNHDEGTSCPMWLPQMCTLLLEKKDKLDCQSDTGCRLYLHALEKMRDMDPAEGWSKRSVLRHISDKIREEGLSEPQAEEVDTWENVCREIIENIREVTKLEDKEKPEKRAILLMLLRPEPKDILNAKYSSLKPGDAVLVLSSILSGAWKGFERLSNEYKKLSYEILSEFKSMSLNDSWEGSQLKGLYDMPAPVLDRVGDVHMTAKYRLKIGSRVLLEKTVEEDIDLKEVQIKAQKAGYTMDYDSDNNRLWYQFNFKDKRKQTVYISKGKDNRQGESTVRFWSPCMDLSKPTNMKKLTKDKLQGLMKMNCDDIMNCRFGMSDKEKAIIVLVDQIVKTMDEKELKSHIESVAFIADGYEEKAGLDQY